MDDNGSGAGEREAIERLRQLLPSPPGDETWIGDDAAVVKGPSGALLLTVDMVVAGVHADLTLVGLDDLGWKAVAVNVSDIAAMAGRPRYAVVAVAGPPDTDLDLLYRGIDAAAAEHCCAVVGGDLSNADQLVVSVAMTGECPGGRPVLRSGARPGDHLFVTGPLGRAAAGLRLLRRDAEAVGSRAPPASSGSPGSGPPRSPDSLVAAHRRPRARVAEGLAAAAAGATAMIDVSDGLASELRHVADASGVGVVVELVPTEDRPEVDGLFGGEDYELLFSAPDAEAVTRAFRRARLRPPIRIGHVTGDRGERRLREGPLPAGGWEHRFR